MLYSRETLEKELSPQKSLAIFYELLEAINSGKDLTIAESKHFCGIMGVIKKENGTPFYDKKAYEQCKIPIFIETYLTYFNNLDGWNLQQDYKGYNIPLEQRLQDAQLLNESSVDWESLILGERSNSILIWEIQKETKIHLNDIVQHCKKNFLGYNRFLYLKKGVLLHSKFIYLTILGYEEENKSLFKAIEICGRKIVFDASSYVHILFRHYAADVKEYQQKRSYHFKDFDHRNLPNVIFEILKCYNIIITYEQFSENIVYFSLNGTIYSLWWKRKVYNDRKDNIVYLIKTLYPVEKPTEIQKIKIMAEKRYSDLLIFFI